jgi:acyl carrier protein
MRSAIDAIKSRLREIFPDLAITIIPTTLLGDLPEWDSMLAVNLQSDLHKQFNMEIPLELLTEDSSVEEIAAFLRQPDVIDGFH